MAEISVCRRADGAFDVLVKEGALTTSYVVNVPDGLSARLGAPEVAGEELVRESFVFLLEREPPSSILRRFSLDVIGRYFPEYEREMGRRLSPGD